MAKKSALLPFCGILVSRNLKGVEELYFDKKSPFLPLGGISGQFWVDVNSSGNFAVGLGRVCRVLSGLSRNKMVETVSSFQFKM